MLQKIDVLAVQSKAYARRLIDLGANTDCVHVTGSIKFDGVESSRANPRTAELRQFFRLREDDVVFIAGSTQDPEERFAIESYLSLCTKHPRLRLILVPRHKERFDEVARLVTYEYNLPLLRRSSVNTSPCVPLSLSPCLASIAESTPNESTKSPHQEIPPILLLDTLGELSSCWGLATIAFVGGSLTQRGGQNMIEPAGYGAAVLFGPNTWNFKDVVELLLSHDAALVVRSGTELTARLEELLADPARAAALGDRARELVTTQRGATARTVELLERMLLPEHRTKSPLAA
jgi:3-deoxy-D-manno-octulosonic-acid transferase